MRYKTIEVVKIIIGVFLLCVLLLILGGKRGDVVANLLAEAIVLTLSLFIVDTLTRLIDRKREEQQREPLEGIIYGSLFRIVKDLVVTILPMDAYTENDRRYENIYGDIAAPGVDLKQKNHDRLFLLIREHIERKCTMGETFDTALLTRTGKHLKDILDRSSSFLDPVLVSHLMRLENRMEYSIALLSGMKDKDWQEELSRQKVTYSLSLIASSVVKVREWLDRTLDERFKEVA